MNQEEISFKQRLHQFCLALIDQKLDESRTAMEQAKEALLNDSKSSAGDKHETGRAMAHLEQEKIAHSVQTLSDQRDQLAMIDPGKCFDHAQSGSIVELDMGSFYVSTALGHLQFEGKPIYCISPQAPLFAAIRNKQKGEVTQFNNKTIKILNIF